MKNRESFRLIINPPAHPAFNMALDEVLLKGCIEGGSPFLRFYGWDPPGLSIGRFQRDLGRIKLQFCRDEGIPVVRRLTGGRAVLHHHEVTYSIASRFAGPFENGSVIDVYSRIAAGLSAGLGLIGIEAEQVPRKGRTRSRSPNCFTAASRCELTWRGRKVIGSAQRREGGCFLQHGSILTDIDGKIWGGIFQGGEETITLAASLGEILGREIGFLEVADAMVSGFERALGIDFKKGDLTEEEIRSADVLAGQYLL